MIISSWNIRGLNCPLKQKEISKFILKNHIDVLGIIETKVRMPNQDKIQNCFMPCWKFITNSDPHAVDRIWIGWNPNTVSLTVKHCNQQIIHVLVSSIVHSITFEASFIYGYNNIQDRRPLWCELRRISASSYDHPWICLGDFNVVLQPHEIFGGNPGRDRGIDEFTDAIFASCLVDLRFVGLYFTWNNKRTNQEQFIMKKLDRVLINQSWLVKFPAAFAEFLPPGISDHSPALVRIIPKASRKGKTFRFYNYWTSLANFKDQVTSSWSMHVEGNFQFQLCHKLRHTKMVLKHFVKDTFGKERAKVECIRLTLEQCQRDLDTHPSNSALQALEKALSGDLGEALRIEEEVLRQKSRVQWLESGDRNTAFFHHMIRNRRNANRIVSLITPEGTQTISEEDTKLEAIRYFKSLLGSPPSNPYPGMDALRPIIQKRVPEEYHVLLDAIPTDEEIKNAMFCIHSNKAPGPDGFNACFFKDTWNITGPLVVQAVREFFETGELLKEANATIIALLPKIPNPSCMGDFRPISCCNTVYKCISKIISKRIQMIIPEMVDSAQSAFIKGRHISDNILLAQDLMRDYHKPGGIPRVAAKVDIMKAYDSVRWEFLMDVLHILGFPPKLQGWIKACITSTRFSINFNGEPIGYFAGAKGLRQGDPMSPYLFVLVMDVLSQVINFNTQQAPHFKFHWRCDKLSISHLCFADDLLLFCFGDVQSAMVLKKSLDMFYDFANLRVNPGKSCLFMAGIGDEVADLISQIFPFSRVNLPLKYLGVPLISTKLKSGDCSELVQKISNRILSWTSKFLSYAGRVQLIQSVLAGIQNYWAGMFILPKGVIKQVDMLLRRFLWSGGIDKTHGAKVAWDKVCSPKKEGGLGFKNPFLLNTVLNLKHIWNLFSPLKESLWVKWVHTYLLKDKSFWTVKPPSQCSWYWKKLLKLRDIARPMLKHRIGNGCGTFLWYDDWHPLGPLLDRYGQRVVYDAAISLNAKVSTIIDGQVWHWPMTNTLELMEIREQMQNVPLPSLTCDSIRWVPSPNGRYSTTHTWDSIRPPSPTVPWFYLVWFPGHLPRHSIVVWFAILKRLSTHDRIASFTLGPFACSLCNQGMETHDHLFFNCPYSSFVWQGIQQSLGVVIPTSTWDIFFGWAGSTWRRNSPGHIIPRICLGATVYSIWQERNARTFKNELRTKHRLLVDIRYQICSQIQIKYKHDPRLQVYTDRWS